MFLLFFKIVYPICNNTLRLLDFCKRSRLWTGFIDRAHVENENEALATLRGHAQSLMMKTFLLPFHKVNSFKRLTKLLSHSLSWSSPPVSASYTLLRGRPPVYRRTLPKTQQHLSPRPFYPLHILIKYEGAEFKSCPSFHTRNYLEYLLCFICPKPKAFRISVYNDKTYNWQTYALLDG
jgi:hypothetical protein